MDPRIVAALLDRIQKLEDAASRRAAQETPINPMTTLGDMIVGGTPVGGAPAPYTRLPAGVPSRLLGISGAGILGWRQIENADMPNQVVLPQNIQFTGPYYIMQANGSGIPAFTTTVNVPRLNFKANTDFWNAGTIPGGTPTLFAGPFGSITKQSATSTLVFSVRCATFNTGAFSAVEVGTTLVVTDPTAAVTTYGLGCGSLQLNNTTCNIFSGSGIVPVGGPAGTYSCQVNVYSTGSIPGVYCRCASQPQFEWFYITCWECG